MKSNVTKCFCLFFVLLSFKLSAQVEQVSNLQYNSVIKSELTRLNEPGAVSRVTSVGPDTLFLPFFDDFSASTVWPSPERWDDSLAFVNFNFPINPQTIGVATFDGLDKEGNPYDNSNANANGLCDIMTSKPINLLNDDSGLPYNPSDSIFLVFFYERKGRGDNPESTDSLVLQFWDKDTQVWNRAWSSTGTLSGDTVFSKVKISINDPIYRQNGFRFRFKNHGSKTGMLDLWHIDYVTLNKFLPPDYEFIRDYAFVYEGTSLLNGHSSIPWKHFSFLSTSQQQALVQSSASLTLRNNNDGAPFPISVAGSVYDQNGIQTPIVGGVGLNNIVIPLDQNVTPPAVLSTNTFFVDPTAVDRATFTAVYQISSTSGNLDIYPQNDTMKYVNDFYNYYAYDDGTAEATYGVNGVNASLAYRFDLIKGDTLRAIQIYFAQLGLSVTNQVFRLAVWTGSSGPSGSPIYEKFNQTPNYSDSINGFYTYNTDPIYLSAGTYYFGWIQNNQVILNLGLDMNTPADASRKYVNYAGSWTNSTTAGMWMIRPVLSESPINTALEEPIASSDLEVYPVPATNTLNIKFSNPVSEACKVRLTDLSGRDMITKSEFTENLDVSHLAAGLYVLHISDPC